METSNRKNLLQKALRKFPKRGEIFTFLLAAAAIINFWAVMVFLYSYPSLSAQMTLGEITGILAVFFAVCLLETIGVTAVTAVLAWIFPKDWLSKNFHIRGFIFLVFILLFFLPYYLLAFPIPLEVKLLLTSYVLIAWWLILIVSIVIIFLRRNKPNEKAHRILNDIVNRISTLGTLFIFLDLASVIYIVLQKAV